MASAEPLTMLVSDGPLITGEGAPTPGPVAPTVPDTSGVAREPVDEPVAGVPAATGLWWLDGAVLTCVDAHAPGPPTVLVPSEAVLTLIVELPLATRAARAAALPYAIEDRIAEPLSVVHVALGAEVAPRVHLAGVVRRSVMAGWLDRLAPAGLGDAVLMPDALALPAPDAGSWSVARRGERVLVRTDAGTGFAVAARQFEAVWAAGGKLPCRSLGEPLFAKGALADGMLLLPPLDTAAISGPAVALPSLLRPPLDLRQGEFAHRARPVSPLLRRLGLIVLTGVLAHGAIAAADTLVLHRLAEHRRSEAAVMVQAVLPGTSTDGDFAGSVAALLPAPGNAARGRFLPVLVRASRALAPLANTVAVDSMSFGDGDAALTLNLEAADLAGLQRAQAALIAGGLRADAGPATSESGRATQAFTVSDGPL